MHYVLRDKGNHDDDDDDNDNPSRPSGLQRQTTVGLSRLLNERAFHYALSLMFGKESSVVIPQDRRISKLHSAATVRQNIVCCRHGSSPPPPLQLL